MFAGRAGRRRAAVIRFYNFPLAPPAATPPRGFVLATIHVGRGRRRAVFLLWYGRRKSNLCTTDLRRRPTAYVPGAVLDEPREGVQNVLSVFIESHFFFIYYYLYFFFFFFGLCDL